MEVSPIILTRGSFKERRNSISKGIPIDFLETFTYNYTRYLRIVYKVWKLRILYQR